MKPAVIQVLCNKLWISTMLFFSYAQVLERRGLNHLCDSAELRDWATGICCWVRRRKKLLWKTSWSGQIWRISCTRRHHPNDLWEINNWKKILNMFYYNRSDLQAELHTYTPTPPPSTIQPAFMVCVEDVCRVFKKNKRIGKLQSQMESHLLV